jgi:hypothetical protein
MTGHTLTLTVTLDGDRLTTRVVCHEAEGADCRIWCTFPGCDHDAEPLPHFHNGKREDGSDWDREWPVGDYGACNIAVWMNEEVAFLEWHEDVDEPLADGMPIVCTWGGDGYAWRGKDTPAAVVTTKAAEVRP